MPTPVFTVPLYFDNDPGGVSDPERLRQGISAVERTGDFLWLACDETPTLERLSLRPDGSFGAHRTYPLADFIDLPADGEVDVEGLAYAAPYLWVVGSNSRKRSKAKEGEDDAECIARLARVETDASRYFLARIPLAQDPDGGGLVPVRSCPDAGNPEAELTAARLRGKGSKGGIFRELHEDAHLRDFLRIPGKDNGFDVEGLAVLGDRIFVGLRGPVLRGWAIILELEPAPTANAPTACASARSATTASVTGNTSWTWTGWGSATCAATATTCWCWRAPRCRSRPPPPSGGGPAARARTAPRWCAATSSIPRSCCRTSAPAATTTPRPRCSFPAANVPR
jgi:hypothetical protein